MVCVHMAAAAMSPLRTRAAILKSPRYNKTRCHSSLTHATLSRARADLAIRGTLHSVDQYLNIKLLGISVEDAANFPHMQSVKDCFVRGSVIKYVQLPASEVDTELLQDAARREAAQQKAAK